MRRLQGERMAWARSVSCGRFEGRFVLEPVGPERFRYLPDPSAPFRFIRSAGGEVIQPGVFETDGGSINVFLQLVSGVTRWKYYKAFPIHDWEFEQHHAGTSDKSFAQVNMTLAEAMATMMRDKLVPWNYHDLINVHLAVMSFEGKRVWERKQV